MLVDFLIQQSSLLKALKDRFESVLCSNTALSSMLPHTGSLFGTAAAVGVSPFYRLSMVSRIVTPSLAIAIANILKTNVSIAISAVVITGLIGASFGTSVFDLFRIKDPIVGGLCMGASAHGLGNGSMVRERLISIDCRGFDSLFFDCDRFNTLLLKAVAQNDSIDALFWVVNKETSARLITQERWQGKEEARNAFILEKGNGASVFD